MAVGLASYDSSKVSSLSLSASQVGYTSQNDATTWAELSFPLNQTSWLWRVGFTFDFSVDNDSEQGLILAPRLPFTSATDDLAGTGETATTWTLTIKTNLTNLSDLVARTPTLYGVITHTPTDFSNSNNPYGLTTTAGGSFVIDQATTDGSGTNTAHWVLNGTTYDLVFNLDFAPNETDFVNGAALLSPLKAIVHDARWTGLLQFILWDSTSIGWTPTFTAATFAGNVHNWHTGATDFPLDRRARVVHDYITGQPYLSDEAVQDGYRDGIMVHPDNYDPRDPLDTDTYTPPPGEGVVDDEVIDTE